MKSAESDVSGNEFAYLGQAAGRGVRGGVRQTVAAKREAYMAME